MRPLQHLAASMLPVVLTACAAAACSGERVAPVVAPPTAATSATSAPAPSASIATPSAKPLYGIDQLLNVHKSWEGKALDDQRFVHLSDAPGTAQLFLHDAAGEHPLTAYPDRISAFTLSRDHKQIAFLKDKGGDENDQLFTLGLEPSAKPVARTDAAKVKHTLPVFDDAGARLAWTSNARNGKDMDLYVGPVAEKPGATAAAPKPLVELAGSFHVLDWRGDRILVVQSRSNVDHDLWVIDAKTRQKKLLTQHQGDEAWTTGHFSHDGKAVFALTDSGHEFVGLVAIDLASLARKTVVEIAHDLGDLAVERFAAPPGNAKGPGNEPGTPAPPSDLVAYTVNVDGVEHLELLALDATRSPAGGKKPLVLAGATGVVGGLDVLDRQLLVTVEDASHPAEVFRAAIRADSLDAPVRVTTTDHAGVDEGKLVPAQLLTYPTFDGRSISLFWYAKPAPANGKLPVVIVVHGGPEAQAQPTFSAVTQYLALAGYAVATPNVRGSLGYGKSFAHLDDKDKREDSVRDLSECGKFLAARPDVDPKQIALFGGSYGGYMVLAGLTLYPTQWAAGVDIVGISDFQTFLQNTAPYRRALREAEYGSLEKDAALLKSISPIHKVDQIVAPLMVIHGTNDPRVPVGETKQIVEALKKRGLPVELMIFDDEGHGLSKLKNRLVAYPAVVAFLDQHVRHVK